MSLPKKIVSGRLEFSEALFAVHLLLSLTLL
jgi:hypothetical protein